MSISRLSIKNAIDKKLIYKNYRWAELKREFSDDTFQDIGETINLKKYCFFKLIIKVNCSLPKQFNLKQVK
jgi:hypothetical protein